MSSSYRTVCSESETDLCFWSWGFFLSVFCECGCINRVCVCVCVCARACVCVCVHMTTKSPGFHGLALGWAVFLAVGASVRVRFETENVLSAAVEEKTNKERVSVPRSALGKNTAGNFPYTLCHSWTEKTRSRIRTISGQGGKKNPSTQRKVQSYSWLSVVKGEVKYIFIRRVNYLRGIMWNEIWNCGLRNHW